MAMVVHATKANIRVVRRAFIDRSPLREGLGDGPRDPFALSYGRPRGCYSGRWNSRPAGTKNQHYEGSMTPVRRPYSSFRITVASCRVHPGGDKPRRSLR